MTNKPICNQVISKTNFFLVGAVEGDENGYDEEYPLESLELNTNDFMAKVSLGTLFFTYLFL
jgi:hypothetical protein